MANAAIESATEYEKAIIEICAITGKSADEVKEFYQSHNYSLEHIKEACSLGAELTENGLKYNSIWAGFVTGIQVDGFEQLAERLDNFHKELQHSMTLKDKLMSKLSNTVFYTGYYLVYPFLWFTDYIWSGIKEAYEDTWGY